MVSEYASYNRNKIFWAHASYLKCFFYINENILDTRSTSLEMTSCLYQEMLIHWYRKLSEISYEGDITCRELYGAHILEIWRLWEYISQDDCTLIESSTLSGMLIILQCSAIYWISLNKAQYSNFHLARDFLWPWSHINPLEPFLFTKQISFSLSSCPENSNTFMRINLRYYHPITHRICTFKAYRWKGKAYRKQPTFVSSYVGISFHFQETILADRPISR